MSFTKEMRRNRDDLSIREQVAHGALLSEERWWTADELAGALRHAQEYLPVDERFEVTSRGAGQILGCMLDLGLVESSPDRGTPPISGKRRVWKLVDSVYRARDGIVA